MPINFTFSAISPKLQGVWRRNFRFTIRKIWAFSWKQKIHYFRLSPGGWECDRHRKLVLHKTEFSFLIGPFSDGENQFNYQIKSGKSCVPFHWGEALARLDKISTWKCAKRPIFSSGAQERAKCVLTSKISMQCCFVSTHMVAFHVLSSYRCICHLVFIHIMGVCRICYCWVLKKNGLCPSRAKRA